MSLSSAPLVLSAGARCATAGNALHVAMLARARKIDSRLSGLFTSRGHRARLYLACDLPDELRGTERLAALGAPALREAHTGAFVAPDDLERQGWLAAPLPLFLALPDSERPGSNPGVAHDLPRELSRLSGVAIDPERTVTFRAGHAGFALALQAAVQVLADPRSGICIALAGGVDSFYDPAVIEWLDKEERLQGPGVRSGFVPGEAAAFLLLARPRPRDAQQKPGILARVLAVANAPVDGATTPAGASSKRDPAEAMVSVIRDVLAAAKVPPRWVIHDVNGEPYRMWEWSRVSREVLRHDLHEESFAFDAGDVGAATGAVISAIACAFFRVGCAPDPQVLVALHSDFGQRGALLLEAGAGPAEPFSAAPLSLSQAQRIVRACRGVLERLCVVASRVARKPFCKALDAAWSALGRLERTEPGDPAQMDAWQEAAEQVAGVKAVLSRATTGDASTAHALRTVEAIESGLLEAKQRLLDTMVARQAVFATRVQRTKPSCPLDGFLASVGTPRLHRLPGARFKPFKWFVAFGQTDEDDEDDEDGQVDADSREEAPEGVAELRRVVRRCIDDIGRLSWLRRVRDSEPWSPSLGRFEQRLLDNMDALMALGRGGLPGTPLGETACPRIDVAEEILRYTSESFTDTARAFARTFLLCCIEGEDGIRSAMIGLWQSHPTTLEAQREAFCLAANPRVRLAMHELCRNDDPPLICLALDVLRARRVASFVPGVLLLKHPDPAVRGKAALALVTVPERSLAVALLERMLDSEREGDVRIAVAESLVLLDSGAGLQDARRKLGEEVAAPGTLSAGERNRLLRLLALAGSASDGEVALRTIRTAEDLQWLGWFGSAGFVDPLIRILEGAMDAQAGDNKWPLRRAAARALDRIIGGQATESGRGARGESSAPELDPAPWRTYWNEHGSEFAMGKKYRHGRPLALSSILDEMEQAAQQARVACEFELAVVLLAERVPCVDDWTARQLLRIKQIRDSLAAREISRLHGSGQWLAEKLGRRHDSGRPIHPASSY